MSAIPSLFCLDANFFVQAWNKYYSPQFCPAYWEIINKFGKQGIIFIPVQVRDEIFKIDDELKNWLKDSDIPVRSTTEGVANCLKQIYAADPRHKRLVDNIKNRSVADPWVIAHAMNEKAVVVTKENKITEPSSKQIKIPNVCDNMKIKWMDDFEFIRLMNIKFHCEHK